jgi:hypothetical protein
VATSFFTFCSQSSVARNFSFELHTSSYSCFTSSDTFWAFLSRMLQHTIFMYLLIILGFLNDVFKTIQNTASTDRMISQ